MGVFLTFVQGLQEQRFRVLPGDGKKVKIGIEHEEISPQISLLNANDYK